MGNEEETSNKLNMEKTPYDKTVSNMKIGVCEMQGWRQTMEDAAIVLPNFQKNTSLFGILDGHGGSIISEFISVNFKNVLVHTKAYENGEYEQALVHTFLIMDELLKDKEVNDFIYNTHNLRDVKEQNDKRNLTKCQTSVQNNQNIIKLRFEIGILEYDLNKIDLLKGGENTTTTVYEFKTRSLTPKGDIVIDSSNNNNENDITNNNSNEIELKDIFFEKGGKQNATLNTLPLFEDVFFIRTLGINFDPDLNSIKKQESYTDINTDKFVANEMGTTANIMLIKNGYIYIANVGDSLSVMYKNKKAYNLNKEHQLIIESEKERVIKSGAIIKAYRINGMLNLTRALGDLKFKSNPNLKRHEQSVIAVPEITKIELSDDIDFIIMGCDGVWDCVKRQLVCEFVDKQIKENPNKKLSDILGEIFDKCVSPVWGRILGTDNMSCIIIQFLREENDEEKHIIFQQINFSENVENNMGENVIKN